ncbi:MAG: dephospho-CoA kinase [Gammaproteobacteria bacterium]
MVIAVTGGIGSGKSTVCALFAERHGVPVIDADQVAREIVEPGTPGLAEIVAAFGREVLDSEGRLDRRHLKAIVFADPRRRHQLEQILHPRIRARMQAHIDGVATPYCLLGIPLLAEGGGGKYDRVLVVDCDEALQRQRVQVRDDLTEAEVTAIMRSQASRAARLAIADDVIVNDGSRNELLERVDALHGAYTELARSRT